MRHLLITIAVCSICATSSFAQTPSVIRHVTRLDLAGTVLDGAHRVTVRWYDVPIGGSAVLTEEHDVTALLGIVELRLGETVGLADTLLRRGTAWLGYSIDGGMEDPIRERVLGAPYARMAERAAVADRLAPEITGIVTSVNEIAGAVRIVGDRGVSVRRDGDVLHIGADATSGVSEVDSLRGDGSAHRFRARIATPLANVLAVTLRVATNTQVMIGATVEGYDITTNEIIMVTTATLAPYEVLHWAVHAR